MKEYTLVITAGVNQTLPHLLHTFSIDSEQLAKEYALRISRVIVNNKYDHFALFRTNEDQQEHLAEWTIVFSPTINHV